MQHPQDLQDRLQDALREIDAHAAAGAVRAGGVDRRGCPRDDDARLPQHRQRVPRSGARPSWRAPRLTSDVELYDARARWSAASPSIFPSTRPRRRSRRQPQAAAGTCSAKRSPSAARRSATRCTRSGASATTARPIAAIVVHVVFDYRTLPFISRSRPTSTCSRQPARTRSKARRRAKSSSRVYGWGLTAIYTSGQRRLAARRGDLHARLSGRASRSGPCCARTAPLPRLLRQRPAVHLRARLPASRPLRSLRPARRADDAGGGRLRADSDRQRALLAARAERPQTGRALLREIRASFYRKLFLAFVLASIVPVLTLALVIRTYFAGLLLDRHPGRSVAHRGGGAARHRGVRRAAAPRRRGPRRRSATT